MPGPLAQSIRAKYPGVYDDMDDASLEAAVIEKYPVYADMADPAVRFTPERQANAELFAGIGTTSGLGLDSNSDRFVDEMQAERFGPTPLEAQIVANAPQLPGALPTGPRERAPFGYPKPPHQRPDGSFEDLVDAATGTFGPEEQSRARWTLAPTAARAAGPIIGGIGGSLLLPGAGTYAGGGIGGAAGELVAQGIQNLPESVTGIPQQREGISSLAVAGAGVIGGVPAAKLARAGMVGKTLGRAAEAAALNQASDTLTRYADNQPLMPTAEEAAFNLGAGALLGGTFGAVEGAVGRLGRVGQASTAAPGTPSLPEAPRTAPLTPDPALDLPLQTHATVVPEAPPTAPTPIPPAARVAAEIYSANEAPPLAPTPVAAAAADAIQEAPQPIAAGGALPATPPDTPLVPPPTPSPVGWSPEKGAARLETLMTTAGSFTGAAAGYAMGSDEEDNRLLYAVLGGVGVGVSGAALAGALGRKPGALTKWRAGMLAQHPSVQVRVTPNSAITKARSSILEDARKLRRSWGERMVVDYHVKQDPQLKDAVPALANFRAQQQQIPHNSVGLLDQVLAPLKDADEYDLFNDITMLRRDMEVLRRDPNVVLETKMDPAQAASYLKAAEAKAAAEHPGVLKAVEAHHSLMHQIGEILVRWGKLDPQVWADQPHYRTDYVLAYMYPKSATGPTSFRSKMNLGYLKQRLGGERETVRDYITVVYRYLNETQQDVQRDLLVQRLAQRFDPRKNGSMPNPGKTVPQGMSVLQWPPGPTTNAIKQEEIWLPTPIRDQLLVQMSGVEDWLKIWQRRINAPQKSVILRGSGGTYLGNNFIGDNVNVYANADKVWRLPRQSAEARRAAWLYHWQKVDPATLSPEDRKLYDLAVMGEKLNIGAAGAAAEIEEQVLRDPRLRRLRQNNAASPWIKSKDAVVDLGTDVMANYELWRTFQENWPRLTLMLNQIEAGHPPEEAAVTTRVAIGDYADRTPFQQRWMSGFFAPFFQWTNKMLENWVPMYQGPGSVGERFARDLRRAAKLKGPIGRMLMVAPFTMAAIAWNNIMFPHAESALEDWEREQFHILIPWGQDERGRALLMYFGFSSPANAIGRTLGVGGLYARGFDAARTYMQGEKDVKEIASEQLERSRDQIRMAGFGMLSPALKAGQMVAEAALTGNATDLRTGRQIFDKGMNPWEKSWALVKSTIGNIPPFSGALAAGAEGGSRNEELWAFGKRLLPLPPLPGTHRPQGSFFKTVDPVERRIFQSAKALAVGKEKGQAAMDKFIDETMVQPMTEGLRGQDPNNALSFYLMLGNSDATKQTRSAMAKATKELAKEQYAWRETSKIIQFIQNHPAWYEKPFIFKELYDQLEDPSAFEQRIMDAAGKQAQAAGQ